MSPTVATSTSLPFDEAIDFLRRKTSITSERWTDIWQGQHAAAFTVAGATKEALVDDLRKAVQSAIDNGDTLETFRKSFDPAVEKHGWKHTGGRDWRSRVIWSTNMRTAYAAGRYEQLQAAKKLRPFWEYRHGGSRKPRPEHLAWHGMILRADDPWWQTHYPPNGWGCSCKVFSVGKRDLRKLGLDPDELSNGKCARVGADGKAALGAIPHATETYEWTSKDGTQREIIPRGVQPGWNYDVGKAGAEIHARADSVQTEMESTVRDQSPEQPWRDRLAEQIASRERAAQAAGAIEKSDGKKVELTGIVKDVARRVPLEKLGFTDKDTVPDNNAIPEAAVDALNERLEAGGFKARVKTIVYNQGKGVKQGSLIVRPPAPDGSEDQVFDILKTTARVEDTRLDPEHAFETMGGTDHVRRVSSVASQKTIQEAFEAAKAGRASRFIGTHGRRYIEVAIDGRAEKTLFLVEQDNKDPARIHWFPVSGAGVIVLTAREREAAIKLKNSAAKLGRRLTDAEIEAIVIEAKSAETERDRFRAKLHQVQREFVPE